MVLEYHSSRQDNHGHDRREHTILEQSTKLLKLGESYTNVHPLVLAKKDAPVPIADAPFNNNLQIFNQALHKKIGSHDASHPSHTQ
jgi:hypothetical protein